MVVKNLLIVSTIFVSACSNMSLEQEPAPFVHSGGKYYHKNGTQAVASYNQGHDNVSYIDSEEDLSPVARTNVRSRPLAPVTSKHDETIKISSATYRAKPVIDDSRSQQVASADGGFVVKPKPVYDRPVRGQKRTYTREVEAPRANPVVSKDDSDYLDLSKVQSFDTGSSKLASVKPMAKPEYSKIETASGVIAPSRTKTAVKVPTKTVVKEIEVAALKPEVREEIVMPPKLANAQPPRPSLSSSRFIKPIDGKVIGNFGDRADGTFNDGINIAASEGAPVKSAADGSVVYSGNQLQGYGNLIIIRHDDGYLTAYAHLKELDLNKGEAVKQGDIIGKVGKSGNVEAPQLHFGVRKGREPVDPKDFL